MTKSKPIRKSVQGGPPPNPRQRSSKSIAPVTQGNADDDALQTPPGGQTVTIKEALGQTVLQHHAAPMLERGGPMQRAANAVKRGKSVPDAAKVASVQGKGHVAEAHHAIGYSLDAGMKGFDSHCQPNARPNDPHADLFITMPDGSCRTVQVGVGGEKYLLQKVRKTKARHLVVNKEALPAVSAKCNPGDTRPTDCIEHLGATSTPASASESADMATSVMTERLEGPAPTRGGYVARATLRGGLQAAAFSGVTTLCFSVIDRVARGQTCDGSEIRNALRAAWDGFVGGALQSYILAKAYFAKAKATIDGILVNRLGRAIPWAGALAEFLIALGKDILRWMQGEIEFNDVLVNAGAKAVEVLVVACCVSTILSVFATAPTILLALLALGAAWFGSKFGSDLGESLFGQVVRVAPIPAR